MKALLKRHRTALLLLALYGLIQLLFLDTFPFVHSDEIWLSGLSGTILEKGRYDLTEPFFDLYPRNPHALKVFFVFIQTLFIRILGRTVFSMRLISLLAGLLSLALFHGILMNRFKDRSLALGVTALLAVDIQFLYASHFARQEAPLLLLGLAAYAFLGSKERLSGRDCALAALILSAGIGIHPNSFIIAFPFGLLLLQRWRTGRVPGRALAAFPAVLALSALLFVAASLWMDPAFLPNYLAYGKTLGVTQGIWDKLLQFRLFYLKLFYGVSGTYYTPDIRLQLFMAGLLVPWGVWRLLKPARDIRTADPLLGLLGVHLGLLLVGRYNQTSILFLFPWLYLLLAEFLGSLGPALRKAVPVLLLAALLSVSAGEIRSHPGESYTAYLKDIARHVPSDARVLSNLNTGYYFPPDRLFDYRNLAHLKENGLTVSGYIEHNGIEYILYPEEMDLIWNTRPVYNSLYGNPADYHEALQAFLSERCRLIAVLRDDTYPMRLVRFMGTKKWTLKIFKVIP